MTGHEVVSSARWLVSLLVLESLACGNGKPRRVGSADAANGQRDSAADQSTDGASDSGISRDGTPDDIGANIPGDAATTDADGRLEAGDSGADVPIPKCVQSGSLYFAAPQPLSVPGGGFEYAIAASTKGKVAAMARWNGRMGLFYVDSLDGGRSFRPAMQVSKFPFYNFRIAAGPDHIYLAAGGYVDSVILWLAPFADLSDLSSSPRSRSGRTGTTWASRSRDVMGGWRYFSITT